MKNVLFVFAFALAATTIVNALVGISGTWENQLGSTMTIIFEDDGFVHIKGAYCTKVARYNLTMPRYPIHGNIGKGGAPTSVGFSVTFEGANGHSSTTAWSGQYREEKGESVIYTTWVLTTPAANKEDIWASTNVGQDVFRRSTDGFSCQNIHKKKKKGIMNMSIDKVKPQG